MHTWVYSIISQCIPQAHVSFCEANWKRMWKGKGVLDMKGCTEAQKQQRDMNFEWGASGKERKRDFIKVSCDFVVYSCKPLYFHPLLSSGSPVSLPGARGLVVRRVCFCACYMFGGACECVCVSVIVLVSFAAFNYSCVHCTTCMVLLYSVGKWCSLLPSLYSICRRIRKSLWWKWAACVNWLWFALLSLLFLQRAKQPKNTEHQGRKLKQRLRFTHCHQFGSFYRCKAAQYYINNTAGLSVKWNVTKHLEMTHSFLYDWKVYYELCFEASHLRLREIYTCSALIAQKVVI